MASSRLAASLRVDRASMWAAVLAAQDQRDEALGVLREAEEVLRIYPDVYLCPRLRLEQAALLPPVEALPLVDMALSEARGQGLRGLELAAQVRLAQLHLAQSQPAALPEDGDPDAVVSRGELLLLRAQVLGQARDPAASVAAQQAQDWVLERCASLPTPFQDVFLSKPVPQAIVRWGAGRFVC